MYPFIIAHAGAHVLKHDHPERRQLSGIYDGRIFLPKIR
jgi:hypothetical protein